MSQWWIVIRTMYHLCVCCSASVDDAVVPSYKEKKSFVVGDDCISFVVVTGSESLVSWDHCGIFDSVARHIFRRFLC